MPNCAVVSVGSVEGAARGATIEIPLSFSQAPSDGEQNQGNDEVAALALTLGMPGTGAGSPLTLADCSDGDGDGVPDGVEVSGALAGFKVVVENADCGPSRTRCLCPSGGGQTRDDFVNLVIYGPRDLSAPVEIPLLPSGELVRLRLRVDNNAPDEIALTVYAQTNAGVQRPTNTALLSIGDKSAIDQTCVGNCQDEEDESKVAVNNGRVTVEGEGICVGDCNHDGRVSTDELVLGISIALGMRDMDLCDAIDADRNKVATVDEVVNSVDNALNECH